MKNLLLQATLIDPITVVIYVGIFLILVFITRAIFSIPRILKELKAQTLLQAKQAEKAGVEKEEIEKILIDAHKGFFND